MNKNTIKEYIKAFGEDPISYSTLQDGLLYLEKSYGFIAYKRIGDINISLGPPICHKDDIPKLLNDYLSLSKKSMLSYIRKDIVDMLREHKLYIAGMGTDRIVNSEELSLNPSKKIISACKKAKKAKMELERFFPKNLTDEEKLRLENIEKGYLEKSHYKKELTFVNIKMSYNDDKMKQFYEISKFDKEHSGIFGFLVLNPFYNKGEVQGYLLDIIRFERTKLWGVWFSIVSEISKKIGKRETFCH